MAKSVAMYLHDSSVGVGAGAGVGLWRVSVVTECLGMWRAVH